MVTTAQEEERVCSADDGKLEAITTEEAQGVKKNLRRHLETDEGL